MSFIEEGGARTADAATFGNAVANAVFHLTVGPMVSPAGGQGFRRD